MDFSFDFEVDKAINKLLDDEQTSEALGIKPTIVETPPVGNVTIKWDGLDKTIYEYSPAYKPATDYASQSKQMEMLDAIIGSADGRMKALQAEMDRIATERDAQLRALRDQIDEINRTTFDTKREKRALQLRINSTMQLIRQALYNEQQARVFLDNAIEFDRLTANLYWRQFAYPHQIEGGKHMASARKMILGDKMGLGKSLTSLIAVDMLQAQRILIVVPDDVVSNFVNEIHQWAPHRTVIMLGRLPKASRAAAFAAMDMLSSFVCVINYSAWRKDNNLLNQLVNVRFDTVIMDEAHTVKETTTNAYRGCHKIVLSDNSCPKCGGFIQKYSARNVRGWEDSYWGCVGPKMLNLNWEIPMKPTEETTGCGWNAYPSEIEVGELRSAKNVFPMTGTTILNKPTDLFSLLTLILPEDFYNKRGFEQTYCRLNYDNKWVFDEGGLERLIKSLSGCYLARDRKSAGVILPKQTVMIHDIELDEELYPKQARVIRDLTQHAMLMLETGKNMPILAAIALITRKRQANVWPAGIEFKDAEGNVTFSVRDDVNESIKLDRICTKAIDGEFTGLVPDLTSNGDMVNGERVVIFSQFKQPLAELETRIAAAGIDVVRFDGDTPNALRDRIKIDFDRKFSDRADYDPKWQVVLCNYKTGGVGLNFTAATQMIILDQEWNPGKEEQAMARIDRMGQTDETTVHVLRLSNSIDTWMADLVDTKRQMIAGFETNAKSMQDALLAAMKSGEML